MGRVLVLLILLLPLIEIGLFIVVGGAIGLLPTLAIVVAAGIIGMLALRWQGFSVLNRLRSGINGGELPARSVADAMMIGVAGVLLVIPGFFSDILGLLLLLPPVRSAIYAWLRSRVRVVSTTGGYSAGFGRPSIEDDTIELDSDEYRPR
ncbi:MAG: FxsA family protein [Devosia sp.]